MIPINRPERGNLFIFKIEKDRETTKTKDNRVDRDVKISLETG